MTVLLALMTSSVIGAESMILSNVTVHVVSGSSIPNGQVLVRDGKIAAVGPRVSGAGARVVDLHGQHLYPGLIATATTLGLTEIGAVRATRDSTESGEFTPDVQSWIAVNPDSELFPVTRANGIVFAQPVPQGGIVSGQSALIVLDGWTSELMVFKAPVGLHVVWPAPDLVTTPKSQVKDPTKWKSLEDQARERRAKTRSIDEFFAEAGAYAKARAAGGANFAVVPAWEAMLPYASGERPVFVQAQDIRQITAALAWAAAGNYKMVLVGGRDAWRVADQLAKLKVPVIYSQIFTQPGHDTDDYDLPFRAPSILQKAGVMVVFNHWMDEGADSNTRNLPYAAAQAVAFGLPPDEALKGITLYPAQVLGVADRLGSIETGKDASLISVDGDILDIRRHVTRMWIAGREVSLESRHTRLYDKYRNRPRP